MSQSNFDKLTALGIPLKFGTKGPVKTICPKCSHSRLPENRREACLSVDVDEGIFNCHNNCGFHGTVNPKNENKKHYVKPVWTNATQLSDGLVQYWASRGISQQTLINIKLAEAIEWMPYPGYEIWTMQFPYFRDGELINVKYRGEVDSGQKNPDGSIIFKKSFKLVKDAELIFFNLDAIKESQECLIVEGEPDCMSFIEAGYGPVVSVPNGASKSKNNKLEYLDNCIDYFENKTKIYIGVDNDEPGRALQKELIRRLGAERCWIVSYGDCKDGNEYLVKYGKFALMALLAQAKGAVIEGIIEINDMNDALDDLYDNGLPPGLLTGVKDIDEILSFPLSSFIILTGIPNHGKSPALDYLIARLVVIHDLKCAYCSPENEPTSLHVSSLISILTGKSFEKKYGHDRHLTKSELMEAKAFMQDHYYFISEETSDGYANQFTLDNFGVDQILEYGKKMVLKYGINFLVIDPWNTLEHQYGVAQDKLEYINKSLDKFRKFAKRYNVCTILVAHPTKMQKEEIVVNNVEKGVMEKKWMFKVPDLSNCADSNVFHTKPAIGLTYYRNNYEKIGELIVNKVKHKHVAKYGSIRFIYDWVSGRFNVEGCTKDTGNWLRTPPLRQGYNEPSSVITIPTEAPTVPVIVADANDDEQLPF